MQKLTILYPYLHSAAVADELRWSLRSLSNIIGVASEPLVVGDPPDWYIGPVLRRSPSGGKWVDPWKKVLAGARDQRCSKQFVVWMDDTFAINPIDYRELLKFRYQARHVAPLSKPGLGKWQRIKANTINRLFAMGRETVYDTATHWPYPMELEKLQSTIRAFSAMRSQTLVEVAYANQWQCPIERHAGEFRYTKRPLQLTELEGLSAKLLNVGHLAFTAELRDWLLRRLPEPSPWEVGEPERIQAIPITFPGSACVHLGEAIRLENNTMRNRRDPVFACGKHGECVLERIDRTARPRCIGCRAYEPSNRSIIVRLTPELPTPSPEPQVSSLHRLPIVRASRKAEPVGDHLKAILEKLGIKPTKDCDCLAWIAKMNHWGVEGCRRHRAEIVAALQANYARWGWADRLRIAAKATMSAVISGLVLKLDVADVFGSLLDVAIGAASFVKTAEKSVEPTEKIV